MSLRYRKRLLEHLRHDTYTPRRAEALVSDLKIDDPQDFAQALKDLEGEGIIHVSESGLIGLPSLAGSDEIIGTLRKNPKGFGFVQPETPMAEGDVFVPPESIGEALSGDTVRVRVRRDKGREHRGDGPSFIGHIVDVITRKRSVFTGELAKRSGVGGGWVVHPDGKALTDIVVVRDAESKNAKAGDKVEFELTAYPDGNLVAEGVITRVLGEAGRPDVETQAVIAAHNLPGEFPESCVAQARAATEQFAREISAYEAEGLGALGGERARLDYTKKFVLTIDPPDAKDYDDAISIERLPGGGWELQVHIADVAHFIAPGSPLDVEAKDRGNSCYLPRLVIPMLPEILSNGICSLQEGVHRFCKSAFIRYNDRGEVIAEGVGATLIKSAKRLTYLEAQALIDGKPEEAKKHAKTPTNYTPELFKHLQEMNTLARAIKERRYRQGMISLELPDVVLIYDDEGHVIDAEKEDDAFTHTLIEMFMVEANEVLARLFEKMTVPLLRRVHPEPTPGNVDSLRKTAKVAGFIIPASPTRQELQGLLTATRGTPASRAVHMAVLRTLTRAEYSPAAIGHFALASSAYAHFTSPIRRYADLTVHRALTEYLSQTDNAHLRPATDEQRQALGKKLMQTKACPSEEELTQVGRHITRTEENAAEAEHELRAFLVLQLLSKHIGESFHGVVTGISPRGVFVQLDKYLADGFIKTADLPGDVTRSNKPPRWQVDQRSGALVDQNSGRSFNIGDSLTVCIAQVDLSRRQLDLTLASGESRAGGKAKPAKTELKLGGGIGGGLGGGIGSVGGGFKPLDFKKMSGEQRRSQKSKSRDRGKKNHRRDK
jgi:ribonuclease R